MISGRDKQVHRRNETRGGFPSHQDLLPPPAESRWLRRLSWWELAAFGFLLSFCIWSYVTYRSPLYFDANGYYLAGETVYQKGIFTRHLVSEIRTYGYPLIVAFAFGLSRLIEVTPRTIMVVLQLVVYAGAALGLRIALSRYKDDSLTARLLTAGLCLNVFVLLYIREVLTEGLSAALIIVLFLLLYVSVRTRSNRILICSLAGGSVLCGYLVMIRPGNLFLIPTWIIGQFLARSIRRRDKLTMQIGTGATVLVMTAGIVFPMLLQVRNNLAHFGKATPMPVYDLFRGQQELGVRWVKLATLVPPAAAPQIRYNNPFAKGVTVVEEPWRWWLAHPVSASITMGLHLFSLLDMDVPWVYSSNPLGWYRWPWGVFNHVMVALAIVGGFALWRGSQRAWTRGDLVPRYALLLLAVYGAGYGIIYVPVCTEVRYGFPLMLLVVPFAMVALAELRKAPVRRMTAVAAGVVVYTAAALALSQWVRAQAPVLADFKWEQPAPAPPPVRKKAPSPPLVSGGRGTTILPESVGLNEPVRVSTDFGVVTSSASDVATLWGSAGGQSLEGQQFLFTHANSVVEYSLPPRKWSRFSFSMALDDVGGQDHGTVVYIVRGDGRQLYRSPVIKAMQPPRFASVRIAGIRKLQLVVADAGDGITSDEAYWIKPELQ